MSPSIKTVHPVFLVGALVFSLVSSAASAPRRSYLPAAGPGPIRFLAAVEPVAPVPLPPLPVPDSDSDSDSNSISDSDSDPQSSADAGSPIGQADANNPEQAPDSASLSRAESAASVGLDPNLLMAREDTSTVNPRMLLEFFRDTGSAGSTNVNQLAIPIDFEFSPPAKAEPTSSSATYTAP